MDRKLMRLFLDCPEQIRRVILSEHQREIVNHIREREAEGDRRGITARELYENMSAVSSLISASTQLATLARKGWLTRRYRPQRSGGFEYLYFSVIDSSVTAGPGKVGGPI